MRAILNLLTLLACLASAQTTIASGKRAPEQAALMDIIGAVKIFESIHDGRTPTNWAQISEVLNLQKINQTLLANASEPLDQNYVFVQQRIPVPETQMGDVVLIRFTPALRGETNGIDGRYIISRYDNSLRFGWLAETNVQKMLADAGVTELPKPEPLNPSTNSGETLSVRDVNNIPTTNAARTVPQVVPVAVAPASTQPVTEPTPTASVEPPATPQPAPAADSSSSAKKLVVMLAVALGLAAGFVLFRSKK